MEWYLVICAPGKEELCKSRLEQTIRFSGVDDIPQVIIPTQEEVELKGGQRISSVKKIFPGYLMIEMEATTSNRALVARTPGIKGFATFGGTIKPMSKQDVDNALSRMDTPKVIVPKLKKGESVRIKSGPFNGTIATIEEYQEGKGRVKLGMLMLGQESKVEMDVADIQKL